MQLHEPAPLWMGLATLAPVVALFLIARAVEKMTAIKADRRARQRGTMMEGTRQDLQLTDAAHVHRFIRLMRRSPRPCLPSSRYS